MSVTLRRILFENCILEAFLRKLFGGFCQAASGYICRHFANMETHPKISFDNTDFAFQYKSSKQLKKARFLFSLMGQPWLVKLGTKLTPLSIKMGLPVKGLIRNTIFSQFVGGETLEETAQVAKKLGEYNVQVILDYGVEGGETGEQGFDHSTSEFIRVISKHLMSKLPVSSDTGSPFFFIP